MFGLFKFTKKSERLDLADIPLNEVYFDERVDIADRIERLFLDLLQAGLIVLPGQGNLRTLVEILHSSLNPPCSGETKMAVCTQTYIDLVDANVATIRQDCEYDVFSVLVSAVGFDGANNTQSPYAEHTEWL